MLKSLKKHVESIAVNDVEIHFHKDDEGKIFRIVISGFGFSVDIGCIRNNNIRNLFSEPVIEAIEQRIMETR